MASTHAEQSTTGSRHSALANLVVHLTSEFTGRGPTKARAYINDDLVTVLLSDTFTKGERSLIRDGCGDTVLKVRKAYQLTMRPQLVAGVEEITGRRVIAFLSDNSIEPDMAVEVFVLEPLPEDED